MLDAGAPAWLTEPLFPLEGSIFGSERALPLWNPYSGFGMPLMADMQSQPLDPIAWLPIFRSGAHVYSLWLVIRLYLASAFAFFFLRRFMSPVPAVGGAIAFAFSGYFLMYVSMPEISVNMLIPLLLLAIESLLRKPDWLSAARLAAVISLSIFGGMPESEAIVLAFGLAYAIARVIADPALRATVVSIVTSGSLGVVVGIGSAAVLLVPFLEYLHGSFSIHVSGDPSSWQGLRADDLDVRTLATYVAPLVLGPPGNDIFSNFSGPTHARNFFGAIEVALAFAAALYRSGRSYANGAALPVRFFAIVSVVLLLKRFGILPVQWLGALPLLRSIQFDKYDEPILALCVAALAASAIDRIASSEMDLRKILVGAAVPLAVLGALWLATSNAHSVLVGRAYYTGSSAFALLTVSFVVFATLFSVKKGPTARAAGLIVIALVSAAPILGYVVPLYYVVDSSAPDRTAAVGGAPYTRFLQAHARAGDRVYAQGNVLYPNWSAAFRLHDVRALDALHPERYFPFLDAFFSPLGDEYVNRFTGAVRVNFDDDAKRRFLAISAIRYIVQPHRFGPPGSTLRRVYADGNVAIFEVDRATTRVAFFENVVPVATAAESLATIRRSTFDPAKAVVVEGPSQLPRPSGVLERAPESPVEMVESSTSQIEADVDAPAPGALLLRDTYYPGWTASVDGRDVPILHGDYLFRAIALDRGNHRVVFRYRPASVAIGSALSLSFACCGVALALFGFRVRRRQTQAAGL